MSAAPTLAPSLPFGQAAEHLVVKLRPDLVVQPQFYEGMTHYVIKDPLALKYFRFKIEEYFLLEQFDGKQTLQEVKKAFERKYRPQTISIEDLTRFVAQLHEAGIILIDSRRAGQGADPPPQEEPLAQGLGIPGQHPLHQDPDHRSRAAADPDVSRTSAGSSPGRSSRSARCRCSWPSAWSSASGRRSTTSSPISRASSTGGPSSASGSAWPCVKIIHEFGHGLTAKHYGGEVHEMGILFLVLTPALYCDVTDSWLLPNKWKRIWISAAGIYVECFLASIATFVWWYSTPGLLNSLAMATMFICSVNTIMFNANPLLRYDGYYVMADWLEIPNLRIKSTQFFAYLIQEKVLGLEIPVQSYMPRSRRYLFVTYAVASYIYRWFVTFAILWFLSQVLKPYKLESVSYLLAAGVACSLGGNAGLSDRQVSSHAREVAQSEKGTCGRLRAWRRSRSSAGILLIPTPLRIQGTLVLKLAKPEEVYAEIEGRLVELNVKNGDWVTKDTVLAKLSNPERKKSWSQRTARPGNQLAPRPAGIGQSPELENRAQAKRHEEFAEKLEPTIEKIAEQIGKLTLIANRDGQVVGSPHKETVGQWVKPGKPFCEIGDPHRLEAHLIVDQSDIHLIKPGSDAWIKIYGRAETHVQEPRR